MQVVAAYTATLGGGSPAVAAAPKVMATSGVDVLANALVAAPVGECFFPITARRYIYSQSACDSLLLVPLQHTSVERNSCA